MLPIERRSRYSDRSSLNAAPADAALKDLKWKTPGGVELLTRADSALHTRRRIKKFDCQSLSLLSGFFLKKKFLGPKTRI